MARLVLPDESMSTFRQTDPLNTRFAPKHDPLNTFDRLLKTGEAVADSKALALVGMGAQALWRAASARKKAAEETPGAVAPEPGVRMERRGVTGSEREGTGAVQAGPAELRPPEPGVRMERRGPEGPLDAAARARYEAQKPKVPEAVVDHGPGEFETLRPRKPVGEVTPGFTIKDPMTGEIRPPTEGPRPPRVVAEEAGRPTRTVFERRPAMPTEFDDPEKQSRYLAWIRERQLPMTPQTMEAFDKSEVAATPPAPPPPGGPAQPQAPQPPAPESQRAQKGVFAPDSGLGTIDGDAIREIKVSASERKVYGRTATGWHEIANPPEEYQRGWAREAGVDTKTGQPAPPAPAGIGPSPATKQAVDDRLRGTAQRAPSEPEKVIPETDDTGAEAEANKRYDERIQALMGQDTTKEQQVPIPTEGPYSFQDLMGQAMTAHTDEAKRQVMKNLEDTNLVPESFFDLLTGAHKDRMALKLTQAFPRVERTTPEQREVYRSRALKYAEEAKAASENARALRELRKANARLGHAKSRTEEEMLPYKQALSLSDSYAKLASGEARLAAARAKFLKSKGRGLGARPLYKELMKEIGDQHSELSRTIDKEEAIVADLEKRATAAQDKARDAAISQQQAQEAEAAFAKKKPVYSPAEIAARSREEQELRRMKFDAQRKAADADAAVQTAREYRASAEARKAKIEAHRARQAELARDQAELASRDPAAFRRVQQRQGVTPVQPKVAPKTGAPEKSADEKAREFLGGK